LELKGKIKQICSWAVVVGKSGAEQGARENSLSISQPPQNPASKLEISQQLILPIILIPAVLQLRISRQLAPRCRR
jgi:hypothetical protein